MGNEFNVGLCSTNKCHHFAGPRVFGGVDRQRFTDIPGGRYCWLGGSGRWHLHFFKGI